MLALLPFTLPGIVLMPWPDVITKSGSVGALTLTCSGIVPPFLILKLLVWSNTPLSILTLKFSDVGETESLLTGVLLSGDVSSSADCANAGRANTAIRSKNEKVMHAADRVNDLLMRIDNFLPNGGDKAAREPRPHPPNLSSAHPLDRAVRRSEEHKLGPFEPRSVPSIVRIFQNKCY